MYRVEYLDRDGRFKGLDFDSFESADLFYWSVGYADLWYNGRVVKRK